MKKFSRYTNRIEEFLHSDNGQRFFNIAYSVGAAIVIWGALFKILHLPGGNTLLCVGMGTEIAMFILTAFDRPPKEPNWEELVPALKGEGNPQEVEGLTIVDDTACTSGGVSGGTQGIVGGVGGAGGGAIIMGGGVIGGSGLTAENLNQATEEINKAQELVEATNRFVDAIEGISKQMEELHDSMASGSTGYAEKMADLNRNLSGLNTIYEIQLKSVSGQLEAIDRVNRGLRDIRDMYEKSAADSAKYCEETEKMTQYMRQINDVYARMINAMSIGAAPVQPHVNTAISHAAPEPAPQSSHHQHPHPHQTGAEA